MRRNVNKTKDVDFVVIYTREPHARQLAFKEIAQPLNWAERCALAKKTKDEFKLGLSFVVDDMGDPSRKLFGDVPNPAIFVNLDGTIEEKLSWADASEIERALKAWRTRMNRGLAPLKNLNRRRTTGPLLYDRSAFTKRSPAIGARLGPLVLLDIHGNRVDLSQAGSSPRVILKGAYSSGRFRRIAASLRRAMELKQLDEKGYELTVIMTREPSAGRGAFRDIVQPKNWKERQTLARRLKKELGLKARFLIDDMNDSAEKLFGCVPSPVIMIEKDGVVSDKFSWPEARASKRKLQRAPALPK